MRDAIPYGSWPSPLGADRIVAGALRLGLPQLDAGAVYWLEGRPTDGGRQAVVGAAPGRLPRDLTPDSTNVRTLVHEYGGGDYRVRGRRLVYSDFADQRVWLIEVDDDGARSGEPRPLVPPVDTGRPPPRYADFDFSPDGCTVAAVEERALEAGAEPENRIVALRVPASGDEPEAPAPLASGHDFASFPRFSPDGRRLAYTVWDHPRMPWEGTELYVVDWEEGGPAGAPRLVAGGSEESIFQPRFSPDGVLTFVSDRSGWWNLYREERGGVRALCPLDAEFGRPQWVFGMSSYDYVDEGEILCAPGRGGRERLARLDVASGRLTEIDLPFTAVGGIEVEAGVACLWGGAADRPLGIHRLQLASGECEELRASLDLAALGLSPEELSLPEAIEFESGGRTAHAFFYPPRSPRAEGPPGACPPLLVKSHGGPTSATSPVLNLGIQFWTSRGFAVVDVNYGGSAGYGRAYRELLRGAWGLVDVEDCVNAARWLGAEGRVDPDRLAISGGSAGGYTTLCALAFHDVFRAGASHYGIGDLEALARDTHKFESRYLDGLVGPYPERQDLYRERSPIHAADRFDCPVIFFQGLEDRVVPPSQAEAMVAALAARGIPHAYVAFEGEQHGFRRAENIQRALEAELWFYGQIFGFEADVAPDGVEIYET